MSEKQLFRAIAAESARSSEAGQIVLLRPRYLRYITIFSGLWLVFIACFVYFASYTRREQLTGELMPISGFARVFTPQPGQVAFSYVTEGNQVHAGQVLFRITTDRHTDKGDTLTLIQDQVSSRITQLGAERERMKQMRERDRTSSESRIRSLQGEAELIRAQLTAGHLRMEAAKNIAQTYQFLLEKDYVTKEQYLQKQADFIDQQSRINSLQRDLAGVTREIIVRKSEMLDADLKSQNDTSQLDRLVSSTQQDLAENDAKSGLLIRAPINGTITAITGHIGQVVDPEKPIASIIPGNGELVAELFAPSSAVGFIKSGEKVLLRLQSFPYQKFGHLAGTVKEVSRVALPPNELPGAPVTDSRGGPNTTPMYRIIVNLSAQSVRAFGDQVPLEAGMAVDATVFQETRRIYEWALEPLLSIKGSI